MTNVQADGAAPPKRSVVFIRLKSATAAASDRNRRPRRRSYANGDVQRPARRELFELFDRESRTLPMLSAKTQYAALAMIDLASQYAHSRPVQASRIAERHGIPPQFLLQILHELKRAKVVVSTRGASGGYSLSRPPEEISLADVVDVFETNEPPTDCAAADSPLASALMAICSDLALARRERLTSVSLAELAEGAAVDAEPMWYI